MPYAELHAKSNFSFLEGASHADELVRQAAALGYRALAVTDRNSLAGVVRAHIAAKEAGLPLVVGAEITPIDAPPVVLWATDRAAYGRLCRLITRGRRAAPKGECSLMLDDVAEFAEGLIAGIVSQPPALPGVLGGLHTEQHILPLKPSCIHVTRATLPPAEPAADGRSPLERLFVYRDIFGDRCYLVAELHRGVDDRARLERLQSLARDALAARGGGGRALPRPRADGPLRRRDRDPPRHDGRCRRGQVSVSQRRAASAVARRNPRDLRRGPRRPSSGLARSPAAAASRSTSCVTNIRPSWRPRARRRWNISPNSPGKGRQSVTRAGRATRSASRSSTSSSSSATSTTSRIFSRSGTSSASPDQKTSSARAADRRPTRPSASRSA